MRKCDDCLYRNEPEYNKPCVVYREDCPLYEKEGDGMTCLDCKYFIRLKDGEKGSIKGSCKLRCTSSYMDYRYGRKQACKTYFESKADMRGE